MIYLGSDHAGFLIKESIKKYLDDNKIAYEDLGSYNLESSDYPDYAFAVGKKVSENKNNKGILICGTGLGICIAANKVKGIIAGLVDRKELAEFAITHDGINVLCLSGRYVDISDNLEILKIFLNTEPLHDYHEERVKKIYEYEKNNK